MKPYFVVIEVKASDFTIDLTIVEWHEDIKLILEWQKNQLAVLN